MVNDSILNTIKLFLNLIPSDLEVKQVYLFGSYAKGNEHQDSDIDVAIIFSDFSDFFQIQMQLMRLRRKIDLRIEPHPFKEDEFNNSNPFAFEIKHTGIRL